MTGEEPLGEDTVAGGARIGQVLGGKYRLERLLGRGGMGEVYEARHLVVGRRFAIKLLHGAAAPGSAARARFEREARAAGGLESPHVVAVLDFDVAPDGAPYLVVELLEGESLARVLRREGRLPAARVVSLLLQACAGVAAAHRAGIVHRDLKPDNLFIVRGADGGELLKVLDFGVAKQLGEAAVDVTQSGAVLGTPHYMAPEQARGARDVDERVDVYALGVVGYELLSGQKPHPGESYNAILAHILTEPVTSLTARCPEAPRELARVIDQAMAFEPRERYASVEALSRALAATTDGGSTWREENLDLSGASRPEGRSASAFSETAVTFDAPGTAHTAAAPRARRAARSHRWLWLVACASGLALVFAWRSRPEPNAIEKSSALASSPPALASSASSAPPAPSSAPAPRGVPSPRVVAAAASRAPVPHRSALAPRVGGAPSTTIAPAERPPASTTSSPVFDERNPY